MRRWILTKLIVGSWGFPSGLSSKKSACNAREAGDPGLIPGSGRSPGEGNGNPLQYSCLEKLMDRRDLCATVYRIAESDMTGHAHIHLLWQLFQDECRSNYYLAHLKLIECCMSLISR